MVFTTSIMPTGYSRQPEFTYQIEKLVDGKWRRVKRRATGPITFQSVDWAKRSYPVTPTQRIVKVFPDKSFEVAEQYQEAK